jgi:hypothetical protein
LGGIDADQKIRLPQLVYHVNQRAFAAHRRKRVRAIARTLWDCYAKFVKAWVKGSDPSTMSPEVRNEILRDLRALDSLRWDARQLDPPDFPPDPSLGITVRPPKDPKAMPDHLARQEFWTRPAISMVAYLEPLVGSKLQAYIHTARLFALAFGFPDNYKLIEGRVRRRTPAK